jgi:threonine dehydrogenase-like Zn-dependent dehydrogenase
MRPLLERIQRGEIDPTRVITHRLPLAQAPHGYDIFKHSGMVARRWSSGRDTRCGGRSPQ